MTPKTDRDLLLKGFKRLIWTLALMFLGPLVLYQAFKNQDHPWFIPVLVAGALLALGAVGMGFYSIKTLVDALFGAGNKGIPLRFAVVCNRRRCYLCALTARLT